MRLLLVEDERGLSDALCTRLKREHYTVDVAFDGMTGLDNAMSGIYDLILMDVMLPRMDGIAALRALRDAGHATPVLLLTARSELEDKITGLDAGADDYLTKPFEMGELLARVRALTRRRGEVVDTSITFGDLTLRRATCEIVCGSASCKLGQKEFLLLETLMLNQNQIVTRAYLTEKVWGFDDSSEYNNVEVYVSFVRRKMSFVGSRVQIHATRGIGYSLEMNE